MEEFSNAVEDRKGRLNNFFSGWLEDNYDKLFVCVLGVAFAIRMGIFFKPLNQPVWWDGADYLSAAKRLGLNLDIRDIWYYRRGFLFPLIAAPFFALGVGETGIRFLMILFSTGLVVISYLLISRIFDKKIALFASFGLVFSWILLFFSGRILTDTAAAFFILLSFLFFWDGYFLKKGSKYVYLSAAVFALAVLTRMQSLMMVPVFFLIPFMREKFKMFSNRQIWTGVFIFIVLMLPQIFLYYSHYGNPITDIGSHYLGIGEKAEETGNARTISWASFNYIFNLPYILTNLIFYLFLVGFVLFFADLFIGFDKIFQNENLQKKFFVLSFLLCLFLVMGYVGSVSYVEQRYIITGLPFLFLISVFPLVKLQEYLEKKMNFNKVSSIFGILVILSILLAPNLFLARNMVEEKKMSYIEVKQAGLWIKENSNPQDIIISGSLPQITYYSERTVYPFGLEGLSEVNETVFLKFEKKNKPRYYILSPFEVTPDWAQTFPENHKDMLTPVQVYNQGQNPVLIIYEFKYD